MKDLIHRMNPPGILKQNRGALFDTIGTVFDVVKSDAEKAFYAHFPYLADIPKLLQHGKALSIPRFSYDTDEEYRKRVSAAAFYHTNAGGRSYTVAQLQEHFGDRYTLIDEFLRVHVKVLDFTDEDKRWLRSFLDSTLDPNISIALTEWFHFAETVVMADIPLITAVRKDRDIYPRGLRYDGRIKYDHGQEIRFNGSGTYNGTWTYRAIIPKAGTVSEFVRIPESFNGVRTYGGEINYSGDTEVWSPEDIPNPATYGSGNNDDTLAVQVKTAVRDQAALYPTFDGRISYGGAVMYGGGQPAMIDDVSLNITQRVALADEGTIADTTSIIEIEKKDQDIYPSGLRYDGRIKYDHGVAPCFDGKQTYNGAVLYRKVISQKGTVIDEAHGDIPNPATYNSDSGTQDELKAAVTLEPLEDQGAIPPSFDGRLSYGGAIKYGAELPLATDEIQLKIIRHFEYDGKKSYDGKTYLGSNEEII